MMMMYDSSDISDHMHPANPVGFHATNRLQAQALQRHRDRVAQSVSGQPSSGSGMGILVLVAGFLLTMLYHAVGSAPLLIAVNLVWYALMFVVFRKIYRYFRPAR